MAIYQFKCEQCGEEMERLQKFDDAPPECPNGHGQMTRQISSTWKFTFTNGKGTSGGHTLR